MSLHAEASLFLAKHLDHFKDFYSNLKNLIIGKIDFLINHIMEKTQINKIITITPTIIINMLAIGVYLTNSVFMLLLKCPSEI